MKTFKNFGKPTYFKGSGFSASIIRTIVNLCRSQGFDHCITSRIMTSSKWRHRILHKVGIDVFNYYFNTEFPIDMILRADNPYGTGHGADVPFTMGWYNNPGKFWNLETYLWLVIQSETSLQKYQRYSNWYSVELIHLIGNGEEIWTISIDWNTWKIFFMMDILTRPWFFNIIW